MESKLVASTSRYLVHFIKKFKYLDFCLNELETLADMHGVRREQLFVQPKESLRDIQKNPLVYVNLPNEDIAHKILRRSILIKEIIDVYSSGKTYEELLENVDKEKLYPILELDKSFKFSIEGIGRKISHQEQIKIIESFRIFPFNKRIDIKNGEITYRVVENNEDHMIYFGREIASNRIEEDTFHVRYDLKKRPYLGPTSTDHELAFLMANQGQVKEFDFVYDPFVGTGSIAVSCSHFGCIQYGSDLDIRVLKGYGVGRKSKNIDKIKDADKIKRFDVFTNFDYYGIPRPEIMASDFSKPPFHCLGERGPILDAIICDPPYGVRARTHKIGISDNKQKRQQRLEQEKLDKQLQEVDTDQILQNSEEQKKEEEPHYSMKEQYDVIEIYDDLLEHASRLLKTGGRLVFLYHTDDELPAEKNKFPEHPAFEFICSSENGLTKHRSRHLITMIKK